MLLLQVVAKSGIKSRHVPARSFAVRLQLRARSLLNFQGQIACRTFYGSLFHRQFDQMSAARNAIFAS
jgi:hypothetical protein